jgi:hypothetical protein
MDPISGGFKQKASILKNNKINVKPSKHNVLVKENIKVLNTDRVSQQTLNKDTFRSVSPGRSPTNRNSAQQRK